MDKEAFERARAAYGTGAYDDATLEFLFPQLKESEDERIRYDIMEAVENWFPYERVEEIRAYVYLEKQKELAGIEDERIRQLIYSSIKNDMPIASPKNKELALSWIEKQKEPDKCPEYCVRSHCMGCSIYEKQKEQKPVEIHIDNLNIQKLDPNVVVETRTDGTNPNVVNGSLTYQPVEWSEEGLTEFETAMLHIGESFFGKISGLDPNDKAKVKEQAELLLGLSPKVEWSEEDEDKLKKILATIQLMGCRVNNNATNQSLIDWLKSFRPPFKDKEMKLKILKYLSTRCSSLEFEEVEDYLNNLRPSWRPSEEQMEALRKVAYKMGNACLGKGFANDENLHSLYVALKKLM